MASTNLTELESLARADPLAYGITYVDLLQNQRWEVSARQWSVEIYEAANPYEIEKNPLGLARTVVMMKPTQVGMSTTSMVKMFHFADFWPVRIIYMLPRQQDYLDFVLTRVDPMIRASARLSNMLGVPDSTRAKKLGDSYLYFMEASVEPRIMPADAVFIDELDLSDMGNVATAINRMDNSQWKLLYYLSTPTLPNYGIHGRYLGSDRREWFIKCPHCGEQQTLDWEKNVRTVGPIEEPTSVDYVCASCRKILVLGDIQKGEWVAEKPERSKDSIGYHVTQMMTAPATVLWKHWTDPQQTIVEFYRKRLGQPYEIEGGSVEREDFLTTAFMEPYFEEIVADGRSQYFMGVDQGNELQVLIGKLEPGVTRPKIVHIEFVPFEQGFDRISKLMRLFKIKRAVMDANPNRHPIASLQKDFPGRILMAEYGEISNRFKVIKDPKTKVNIRAIIHRTEGFDDLMASIREGMWQLYGTPANLPSMVENLINHVTGLKRDMEERRKKSGIVEMVGVWRALRADHLAHCMLYLKTAIEIDRGKKLRVAIIGQTPIEENNQTEHVEDKPYQPKAAVIPELISIFAEVPAEQVVDYMLNKDKKGYKIPFPLNFKLKKGLDKFTETDVYWMLDWIAINGHEPIVLEPPRVGPEVERTLA
jgi:hypothetical protein